MRLVSRPVHFVFLLSLVAGLLALVAPAARAQASATDLFISEYVEGSSNNKAIEIYNGTGTDVDLAAQGYVLELYSNGASSPGSTLNMSGTVVAGDVYVVANNSADAAVIAASDTTSSVTFYNGDDALVLRHGTAVIDSFGQVGTDPGSEWPGGGQEDTLRRQERICTGDTNQTDPFDASLEYDSFAQDTFDGLGSHTASCAAQTDPLVTSTPATLDLETGAAGSAAITATDDGTVQSLVADGTLPAGITFTSTGQATGTLDVSDMTAVGSYTITYTATDDESDTGSGSTQVNVADPLSPTLISTVQGNGDATSLSTTDDILVEAVVVGDFQDGAAGTQGDLNGFFLQEEDGDNDGDPATSEGIFVFNGSAPTVDVALGDLVQVTGNPSEFSDQTQISSFDDEVQIIGTAVTPTPAAIDLPFETTGFPERFEGMSVTAVDSLYVAEYFNLDRFGEMVLTDVESGLVTPTQVTEPGSAEYDSLVAANARRQITLDDGQTFQNPNPIPFVAPALADGSYTDNRRRGDRLDGLSGVLNEGFGSYRIQVDTDLLTTDSFVETIARPSTVPDVGGDLTVASFNVLNFFETIDNGTDDVCGPSGDLECRGADNQLELDRQVAKTVSALLALDADVIGLIEIENDTDGSATQLLVDELNDQVGAGTYDLVDTGAIGTDAIRQAFIYRTTAVTPQGAFAVLDTEAFVAPRTPGDPKNRPALAQTFVDGNNNLVTVVVNHLKSKGSGCGAGDDSTDGAGSCNGTRTDAANELIDWLATDPAFDATDNVLVIGDLNSYAMEDPIDAFTGAGYVNTVLEEDPDAYGYVFDAQQGTLDYALASPSINAFVTGAAEFGINADEADLIDYNTDFGRDQGYFNPAIPYRASDHDPVVVGLDFGGNPNPNADRNPRPNPNANPNADRNPSPNPNANPNANANPNRRHDH